MSSPISTLYTGIETLTEESGRSLREISLLVVLISNTIDTVRKSELEISVLVEVVVSSTGLAIGDHGSTDDLNGTITSTVSTGHIGVEVVDGTNEGGVTELLVHVVSTRTGIVSQPNTIGLDGGISLVDLVDSKNLTSSSLQLVELG